MEIELKNKYDSLLEEYKQSLSNIAAEYNPQLSAALKRKYPFLSDEMIKFKDSIDYHMALYYNNDSRKKRSYRGYFNDRARDMDMAAYPDKRTQQQTEELRTQCDTYGDIRATIIENTPECGCRSCGHQYSYTHFIKSSPYLCRVCRRAKYWSIEEVRRRRLKMK